jgi:hypothetical protein
MTAALKQIRHLLQRVKQAQKRRDCASAFEALLQAMRAYGYAMGAETLAPNEGHIRDEIADVASDVFDGCIGR